MRRAAGHKMSSFQKFLVAVLPRRWAASMEANSRAWLARCACGHARSIWELGGVRWAGSGHPRRYLKCPACGEASWHTVIRSEPR